MIVIVGAWLWHVKVVVPGAPAFVPHLLVSALCVDKHGNLYSSDGGSSIEPFGNYSVWETSRWGNTRRLAGVGTPGYDGDGEGSSDAALDAPEGIAVDSRNNVFVADGQNHCIRRIDGAGVITTWAGGGRIEELGGSAKRDSRGKLDFPGGIAFDSSGHLFVADCGNNRVCRIDGHGTIHSASSNDLSLHVGSQIAFDANGSLYVLDVLDSSLQRIERSGSIRTIVDSDDPHDRPGAICADHSGNVYVAIDDTHVCGITIRRLDAAGKQQLVLRTNEHSNSHCGDGGQAYRAGIEHPSAIAVGGDGALYVTDNGIGHGNPCAVRRIDSHGLVMTVLSGRRRFEH